MKLKYSHIPGWFALLGSLLIYPFCAQNPKSVALTVDFTSQKQWNYQMKVQVNGTFAHNDSVQHFSNSAQCLLTGSSATGQPASLIFSLTDVSIASTVIDSAEITNLTWQFENLKMVYFGNTGEIAPVDTANMPLVHIGGWDLYHTMARMIPALPQQPVTAGAVWERERQIPLASTVSKGMGHLYQSFKLDSITTGKNTPQLAYISWKFSYRIEFIDTPSSRVADDIPLLGNGTGTAVFNVTNKYLEQAQIQFKVEKNKQSVVSMAWSEQATLILER